MLAPSRFGTLSASTSSVKPPASVAWSSARRSSSPTKPSRYWNPPGPRPATAARSISPARPCWASNSTILVRAAEVTVITLAPRTSCSVADRLDGERQIAMRLAQRVLGLGRTRAAGEDEAEIARALGQRLDRLSERDRDAHLGHPRHGARPIEPRDVVEPSARRDRDHHHPRGRGLALDISNFLPQPVAQDQLLERDIGPEAQRPRA